MTTLFAGLTPDFCYRCHKEIVGVKWLMPVCPVCHDKPPPDPTFNQPMGNCRTHSPTVRKGEHKWSFPTIDPDTLEPITVEALDKWMDSNIEFPTIDPEGEGSLSATAATQKPRQPGATHRWLSSTGEQLLAESMVKLRDVAMDTLLRTDYLTDRLEPTPHVKEYEAAVAVHEALGEIIRLSGSAIEPYVKQAVNNDER